MQSSQRHSFRNWKQKVEELAAELAKAPTSLDTARKYWAAIDGSIGFDVRDCRRAISTFGPAALNSDTGVSCLVQELRRIAEELGELPSAALISPPLENRIREVCRIENHPAYDDARWLASALDT